MKLLLFFVTISISLSRTTALQYQNLLFNSLPQTLETLSPQIDNTNTTTFELISIDHFLTKQDPSLTHQDLLRLRFHRNLLIAEARSSSAGTKQEVFSGYGTYFMGLGVGTPPQKVYMSLDTGSDIVWLQCSPCSSNKSCYNQSDPIFDPSHSSTFSQIACGDPHCKQLQTNFNGCGGKHNNTCLYDMTYMDGSFSKGTFSTETLTLGPRVSMENISIGCGHDNQGWLTELAGVIGLGRGKLSFITQTKDQFQEQFSYCLAYWFSTNTSYIVFGPSAVPGNAVYTPLVHTNIDDTLYYVNLTGISVVGTPVPGITPSVFDLKSNGEDGGGVIFDSGTTYTRLVKPAYAAFRKDFRAAFQKQPNSTVSVGSPLNYLWFDTCYNISSEMLNYLKVPTVELHFYQGANMALRADNTIVLMYNNETVYTFCLAFESDDWVTTIGNMQQKTFQMVYDLNGSRVGFVPYSC